MKGKEFFKLALVAGLIAIIAGCAPYVITHDLEVMITNNQSCLIGQITDELPSDMAEKNKPTLENIEYLKMKLQKELDRIKVFSQVVADIGETNYEITGSILEYKKGNGFVRFISFGLAGGGKITIELKLINKDTDEVMFAGNYSRVVASYIESRNAMFSYVARDFANSLKKQVKNIRKQAEGN